MKRFVLMLAAVAAAATSPLLVADASAQGRGDRRVERGDGGRWRGGEERGWRGGEDRRGPRFEDRRGGADRRGPRFEDRRDDRRFEDRRRDERRQYAPPPEYTEPRARPRTIRPGGYLPPEHRGETVRDFQRYRLRPPPHGYAWVRSGNAFLLVSLIDGRVYDVVVD